LIYTVRHRTTYSYGNAVAFARCVLRLTPVSSASQTLLEYSVTVTPTPSKTIKRMGPFNEGTETITIEKPHAKLIVVAHSRVDVHAPSLPIAAESLAWEQVRAQSLRTADLGPLSPAIYLYPSLRTPVLPQLTAYGRDCFPPGRPVVEAVAALMDKIYTDFTYDSEATTVSTPARDAFEKRRGVCQDFAHIMISVLKGLGLPAAYVSGYLRTIPPPGKPRLEGADATHAWIQVWCGTRDGWVGFDPTNSILVRNDHVTLAVGRDYSDVAPIDGIMLSPGKQEIKVEVDVIPDGERAA